MIHGARAVMFRLTKHEDRRSQWLKELAARRGFNRAIVALANKTARIAWTVLTRKEDYLPPHDRRASALKRRPSRMRGAT